MSVFPTSTSSCAIRNTEDTYVLQCLLFAKFVKILLNTLDDETAQNHSCDYFCSLSGEWRISVRPSVLIRVHSSQWSIFNGCSSAHGRTEGSGKIRIVSILDGRPERTTTI